MDSTQTHSAPEEGNVPDERAGQYARLEEIGRGAQSAVWLAVDEFLGREVALKEILTRSAGTAERSESSAALHRFLREARVTARLDHPNIVPVHELARRPDGTLFCAQKLIRGETLKSRFAACDSLEGRLALLPHLIDACQAVAYAHSRGVIHRDLKPSNIMVGSFGETVVVDWGLAKQKGRVDDVFGGFATASDPGLTAQGMSLGTPSYMSPEQVRGAIAEIDERSDVFGLGVILYELLSGRLPFEGSAAEEVMSKVLAGRYPPVREVCPEAPPELAAVAERALRHDPAGRYAGAEPLAKELVAYRAGGRVAAYEYRSWDLAKKFVAQNRALSAVSLAGLLLLIGASAAISWQLHQAHLSLARSFLERARVAAKSSDWARAAGYYAASRVESDSREGKWGVATASERMPRRVLARSGPPGSYGSVVFLPDGRGLVLSFEPGALVGRELESGNELWRSATNQRLRDHGPAGPGQIWAVFPDGKKRYFDTTTGRPLAEFPRDVNACRPLFARAPVLIVRRPDGVADLLIQGEGGSRMLMSGLAYGTALCARSADGKRLAVQDSAGIIHLWDLVARRELGTRYAPDASDILFTAHGLAVVREQSVQLIAENAGDVLIATPGMHANNPMSLASRSPNAVSPDGHLLVVGHLESSQADLIDLSVRRVVSSVSYPAGRPRFAFSPTGERLLAAGLSGDSMLVGWDIRRGPPPPAVRGSPTMSLDLSRDGKRFLFTMLAEKSRLDLHDASGQLLRTFDLGETKAANGVLSPDGTRVIAGTADKLTLLDPASGETIWSIDCRLCLRSHLSTDGQRLVTHNGKEIVLWDVGRKLSLWRDSRAGSLSEPLAMSSDGRRVAWGSSKGVYLRAEGAGDQELQLQGDVVELAFDESGDRLAVLSSLSTDVYAVEGLHPIFRTPNSSWMEEDVHWSNDDSALIVWRGSGGSIHSRVCCSHFLLSASGTGQ